MLLIFILSLFLDRAGAADRTVVSKDMFIQQIRHEGLKAFCSENGMPRCFRVDNATCKSTYTEAFAKCERQAKIPSQVSLIGPDEAIHDALGACIGTEFSRKHFSKFKAGTECAIRQ